MAECVYLNECAKRNIVEQHMASSKEQSAILSWVLVEHLYNRQVGNRRKSIECLNEIQSDVAKHFPKFGHCPGNNDIKLNAMICKPSFDGVASVS